MRKVISYLLWVVIAYLVYLNYDSIMEPIRFGKEKKKRYTRVIDNLKMIRDSQEAFKEVTGKYSSSFDELIPFLDTAQFTLLEKRDTSYMEYNKLYRMDMMVEKTIVDTLGYEYVKDRLFAGKDVYKTMRYVPFTDTVEFQIQAGSIDRSGINVPVFCVKVDKRTVLKGLATHLIRSEEEAIDVKGKYLQIGSMEKITIAGNWAKVYESDFKSKKRD